MDASLPPIECPPLALRSIEPVALEAPLDKVVATPFASIRTVVALFVVVRDEDGVEGWGEIWCNFPRFAYQHRARLVREVFAPMLAGKTFASPEAAWASLTAASNALRLQSGEYGPIAAVVAGIDIALHDLVAKRLGQPLWRRLGGAIGRVRLYASLGRADETAVSIERAQRRGFRALKLRSMGTIENHLAVVGAARAQVGPDAELMLDVNATWDADDAIAHVHRLGPYDLAWLEEPIPVDAPAATWRRLAEAAPMPLAGGENMITPLMFESALAHPALAVLQPDVTKWGGISGGLALARRIVAGGRRYCPHMFTGAPGLLASAHMLAAAGVVDGMLEYGVGFNPMRDDFMACTPVDGTLDLGEAPGLGFAPDAACLDRYRVAA